MDCLVWDHNLSRYLDCFIIVKQRKRSKYVQEEGVPEEKNLSQMSNKKSLKLPLQNQLTLQTPKPQLKPQQFTKKDQEEENYII